MAKTETRKTLYAVTLAGRFAIVSADTEDQARNAAIRAFLPDLRVDIATDKEVTHHRAMGGVVIRA